MRGADPNERESYAQALFAECLRVCLELDQSLLPKMPKMRIKLMNIDQRSA